MKKHIISFALLLVIGFSVFGVLYHARTNQVFDSLTNTIAEARAFSASHPALAIAAFSCVHLLCSTFSLPASCTILNTLSGAVFGFWLGCAIVYPITLVSAALVYFAGTKLRGSKLANSYAEELDRFGSRVQDQSFLSYVALRLVPLLPFAMLNVIMGIVRVPFNLFILTTAVGIFFDVTVLNSLGAGAGTISQEDQTSLAIAFFALLIAFFLLRILLAQAYDQKTQGSEA